MLGLIRQHGLTEAAEQVDMLLQAEMVARKKAEDALVRSERLAFVGRVVAVLAHEINNPLDAVMNILFIAQTTAGLPESVRPCDGDCRWRIQANHPYHSADPRLLPRISCSHDFPAQQSVQFSDRVAPGEIEDEASDHRKTVRHHSAANCLSGRTTAGAMKSCSKQFGCPSRRWQGHITGYLLLRRRI